MIIRKSNNNINKIITALRNGAVLVCPTDTVYGLICDASNRKAVAQIFKIKKREKSKPVGIFVKDIKTASNIAIVKKEHEKFLKNNKVTSVLLTKKKILSPLVYKGKTIGIRIPKYKFLNLILDKYKKPLAQTSANISGKPATTKIKNIINDFENENVLIVGSGDLPKNKPSAIINLTTSKVIRK